MSDYLKSAFGYLNGSTGTNEYVGQVLEISNVKLRVNRLIAEGKCSPFTIFNNNKKTFIIDNIEFVIR